MPRCSNLQDNLTEATIKLFVLKGKREMVFLGRQTSRGREMGRGGGGEEREGCGG